MPHLFARFVITNTKTPKQSLTSVFSISCTTNSGLAIDSSRFIA